MKIVLGADQGGVDLKNDLSKRLTEAGYEVTDLGLNEAVSIDYPDKAVEVCRTLLEQESDCGIIVCGTGIGVSIAANKVPGIRAAHCSDCFSARMAREHNDANVITLGGRTLGTELAFEIVTAYLTASFAGGRHQRRVDKINALDER